MLDELYQDLILEYAESQTHRNEVDLSAVDTARVHNPLCGDMLALSVKCDDGCVEKVSFSGHGCLISQAAAAIMAAQIEGKPLEEVKKLARTYRSMLAKLEIASDDEKVLGDLTLLRGVSKLPARHNCALLAVNALNKIIEEPVPSVPTKPLT